MGRWHKGWFLESGGQSFLKPLPPGPAVGLQARAVGCLERGLAGNLFLTRRTASSSRVRDHGTAGEDDCFLEST